MEDGIYPPSVSGVPSEFIQPSGDYQRQVYAVFISLMVFIVFYGSILVASLGYLIFCVVLIVQYFQRQGYAHQEKDPVSLILMAICFFVFLFLD